MPTASTRSPTSIAISRRCCRRSIAMRRRSATTCRLGASTRAAQRALDRMSASDWIESRVPGGAASRLGRLRRQRVHRGTGRRPVRDQRRHRRGIAQGLAARPLLAVRGIGPALSHPRRQRPARADARRAPARAHRRRRRGSSRWRGAATAAMRVTIARDQRVHDEIADRVVLALPFTLLREVDLAHAGFAPRKLARDPRARHGPQLQAATAVRRARVAGAAARAARRASTRRSRRAGR